MSTPSTSPQAEQQTQNHESERSFNWLIILLAIVAAFLLALYFINFNGGWGNQGDFGAFGDFLGGVLNPILGFATVGLLIWSLKMQREELALTRSELEGTKEAMQAQVSHLQNEAKLNELMRVMADLRTQCQLTLDEQVTYDKKLANHISFYSEPPIYEMKNIRIRSLLLEGHNFSTKLNQDTRNLLHVFYLKAKNTNTTNQWIELEKLLIHFAKLVVIYNELSSNPVIANIYLDEARKMLEPFQCTFNAPEINNQLDIIYGVLYPNR
ncbi:hypothetical protein [Shewanella sp. SM74]|uniref:hypothetical protein n=1 Tax=Shewanella sp. SM74 TaxID=2912807 RepID=UPI000DFF99D9|nr:hypothetical protein [Shewanella sp. SM74]MCU8010904.1 hypothetical protein [Shewanella sp. SM74]RBP80973.1 hypothetical protein DET47_104268 [Shewanella putrefaciens]